MSFVNVNDIILLTNIDFVKDGIKRDTVLQCEVDYFPKLARSVLLLLHHSHLPQKPEERLSGCDVANWPLGLSASLHLFF